MVSSMCILIILHKQNKNILARGCIIIWGQLNFWNLVLQIQTLSYSWKYSEIFYILLLDICKKGVRLTYLHLRNIKVHAHYIEKFDSKSKLNTIIWTNFQAHFISFDKVVMHTPPVQKNLAFIAMNKSFNMKKITF